MAYGTPFSWGINGQSQISKKSLSYPLCTAHLTIVLGYILCSRWNDQRTSRERWFGSGAWRKNMILVSLEAQAHLWVTRARRARLCPNVSLRAGYTKSLEALANENTLLRTHCCPWCFWRCANWETFVADTKCFWTKSETFFASRTQNLCPQQMLRARANGEAFVSATMCPRLPGALN